MVICLPNSQRIIPKSIQFFYIFRNDTELLPECDENKENSPGTEEETASNPKRRIQIEALLDVVINAAGHKEGEQEKKSLSSFTEKPKGVRTTQENERNHQEENPRKGKIKEFRKVKGEIVECHPH